MSSTFFVIRDCRSFNFFLWYKTLYTCIANFGLITYTVANSQILVSNVVLPVMHTLQLVVYYRNKTAHTANSISIQNIQPPAGKLATSFNLYKLYIFLKQLSVTFCVIVVDCSRQNYSHTMCMLEDISTSAAHACILYHSNQNTE